MTLEDSSAVSSNNTTVYCNRILISLQRNFLRFNACALAHSHIGLIVNQADIASSRQLFIQHNSISRTIGFIKIMYSETALDLSTLIKHTNIQSFVRSVTIINSYIAICISHKYISQCILLACQSNSAFGLCLYQISIQHKAFAFTNGAIGSS